VDSACSSSTYAFEQAYRSILNGYCDSAIVGGAQLCLHPYISLQFSQFGVLSPEGSCKVFDNDGKHSSAVRFSMLLLSGKRPFAV
jgi:fatty acid synthase